MPGIQQFTPQLPNNDPQGFLLGNSIIGDFNTITNNGSGYGASPAAEKNQTYFAYFSSVGGTGPEIIDHTSYFLKYLIDAQGNVVTPQPNSINTLDMLQNFESGKVVNVTSLEGTTLFSTLLGTKTITNVGKINTLLVSQTGSGVSDFTPSLDFIAPNALYTYSDHDFGFKAVKTTSTTTLDGAFRTCSFQGETYDPSNQYSTASNFYVFSQSTITANNPVSFKTQLNIQPYTVQSTLIPSPVVNAQTTVIVRIRTASISAPTAYDYTLAQDTYVISSTQNVLFTAPYSNFASGSRVRVEVTATGVLPPGYTIITPPLILANSDTYFTLTPQYVTNITATSPYFTTGSNNDTYLTASTNISNAYSFGMIAETPTSSLSMSFSNIIIDFKPQPGDFIRFEYNPSKIYIIYEVITDGNNGLVFKLDREILEGTNINNFVMYRIDPNSGNQIILNVKKPTGTTGQQLTGFIKPQYMSDDLEKNFTTIIQKLAAEGTI